MQTRNYNFLMDLSFDEWLTRQARIHKRSKTGQLQHILTSAQEASEAGFNGCEGEVVALLQKAIRLVQPVGEPEL